jgi:hypothetical protein
MSDPYDDSPTAPQPESLPPTAPLGAPIAPHVPIANAPADPYEPAAASPPRQPRTWLWVIVAALAAGAIVAVIMGLTLGQPNRPLTEVTATPSAPPSSTPSPADQGEPLPDEPAPTEPPPAPEPTEPPATEPPGPEPTPTS